MDLPLIQVWEEILQDTICCSGAWPDIIVSAYRCAGALHTTESCYELP